MVAAVRAWAREPGNRIRRSRPHGQHRPESGLAHQPGQGTEAHRFARRGKEEAPPPARPTESSAPAHEIERVAATQATTVRRIGLRAGPSLHQTESVYSRIHPQADKKTASLRAQAGSIGGSFQRTGGTLTKRYAVDGSMTERHYRAPPSARALAKVAANNSTMARTPLRTASETSSFGP